MKLALGILLGLLILAAQLASVAYAVVLGRIWYENLALQNTVRQNDNLRFNCAI